MLVKETDDCASAVVLHAHTTPRCYTTSLHSSRTLKPREEMADKVVVKGFPSLLVGVVRFRSRVGKSQYLLGHCLEDFASNPVLSLRLMLLL
jgi:hypothetical protein